MWVLWIMLANAGIMIMEYVYRQGSYPNFTSALPVIIVPLIMGQVGLFYGFAKAPSLFFAGAVFTLINTLLRVVNTLLLGESINGYNILGIVLLVTATILLKIK